MVLQEKFPYVLDNLDLYSPGIVEIIIGCVLAVGCVVLFRWIFLYSYGWKIVRHDASELKRKKETLSDLILMKDIQTELEKEIEQAMLKATFQG
jgi:hypothetical protein